ncbi:MAG: DUF503 domain-containing protein [Actinomycetota bacterium]|nr:DUF503 domain-containing protein [Actinomycetota bacterium]
MELRIPAVQSLKQKRRRVKGLVAGLRKEFPVGVAEVDYQDLWQRTTLGVVAVAPQAGQLERLLHSVERYLRHDGNFEVLEIGVAYLEEGR